jgi:two-component system, OmpR family, sensor histidine kinase KdpD
VRERVPDWVVRRADQIELVDSSPEQLRRRMIHGNIYPPDRVQQALTHFFRTDNLIALRELALRFLADETEEELLDHLRRHHPVEIWETAERIMVAVTGSPGDDAVIHRAARIAARVRGDVDVLHLDTGDALADRGTVATLRSVAADVGARWHDDDDDDAPRAIARFAREHHITQIIIGAHRGSRWHRLSAGGSNIAKIIKAAGDVGIDVHVLARLEAGSPAGGSASSALG